MQIYGTFSEKGYAFQAYTPTKDGEPAGFELRILIGDQIKHSLLIPMLYTPTFGVDVGDTQQLNSVVDQVLELLPLAEHFDAATTAAQNVLEASIGGTALREDHANDSGGRFKYTEGLFAQSFASLLGGREAMDKWMEAVQQDLGGRTPVEALHLGMVPEVLKLLQSQKR